MINKNYAGHYKDTSDSRSHCFETITIYKDSSAVMTWWTDIRMTNKGSWSISNDTLKFIDSSYRKLNKTFVHKNGKLMATDNQNVYKKKLRTKDADGRVYGKFSNWFGYFRFGRYQPSQRRMSKNSIIEKG